LDSFQKRLKGLLRELPGLELGHIGAVHRARVASRRLRELLPLLELNPETTRKLNRQLRRVTQQLGRVRELDVLSHLIDEFDRSGRYPTAALTQLRQVVGRERDAVRERLAAKLPTSKLERLADRLERAVKLQKAIDAKARDAGARGTPRTWLWALDARLARRAARVRDAIEMAGALYAPEPLHDVRIALKKLRYAAELSLEAERPRLTADIAALKAAQGLLGRLHDYETLVASGRDVQASPFPPDLATWRHLNALVHGIENDCRQMHARYMRDRTRLIAIADRFSANQSVAPARASRAAG
jgi:CHAD domain-containing protein